ncbi:hypothetical protein D3C73_1074770 [compost metagenome]
MVLALLRQQVAAGNLQLLQLRIAGNEQHLHPVQQRTRNVMHGIGRRHEHNVREVERQLHKVVAERIVLFRVKHLQQRCRRVTAEISGHLIDFVQ